MEPILPSPTMPIVLPSISYESWPAARSTFHWPPRRAESSHVRWRYSDSMRVSAISATPWAFVPLAVATGMPSSPASATGKLSNPALKRLTRRSFFPACSVSGVILAPKTMRNSASATARLRSSGPAVRVSSLVRSQPSGTPAGTASSIGLPAGTYATTFGIRGSNISLVEYGANRIGGQIAAAL